MIRSPWDVAADLLDPPTQRYMYDPAGWARDHILWKPGENLTFYQMDALDTLIRDHRTAVRGPHGLGKTTLSAITILWFAFTRDMAGYDWKIPTTASAWRQLTHFLWPEIRKWARRINYERLGREPLNERSELLALNLKLNYGEAFAAASNNPALIEGAHADHILYVFDEAKAIPDDTFDAAEGAFSGAGTDTQNEAYALATSTPGEPNGRFYDIHARKTGLEDWTPIHVTLQDTIKAKRVSRMWANNRANQWGLKSAVYANRVLGEFATSDEDGVIPLAWVEAANQRWLDYTNPDTREIDETLLPSFHTLGVDVATTGKDKTVFAYRYGNMISRMQYFSGQSTTETAGKALQVLRAKGGRAVVDVIGVGAGVVDQMRENKAKVVAFNASERTDHTDTSGELGFINKRSAAWWGIRELLDPDNPSAIALPPDDILVGDLVAPKWSVTASGKIQVESKDDIYKRIKRSTDAADAVVQSFWEDQTKRKVLGVAPLSDTRSSHWR